MGSDEQENIDALTENTAAVTDNTAALTGDPIKVAKDLTDALEENTKELTKVRKRYRYSMALILLLILIFGFAVKSKHDSEISNCRRGNDLRSQVDQKFGSIADFIKVNTPAERFSDTTQAFLDLLNSNFPTRNCGDVGWL